MDKTLKKIGIIFVGIMMITILLGMVLYEIRLKHLMQSDEQHEVYERMIEIASEDEYIEFVHNVNNGESFEDCLVTLTSDLNFFDIKDIPAAGNETAMFSGVFNGDGHKIAGMVIENPDGQAGMFGKLNGIVKNLRIENSRFSGAIAGGIAAECSDGAVLNCFVDASVEGDVAGSVVGQLRGNVINCVSAGTNYAGEISKGSTDTCYPIQESDIAALNQNLQYISGYYSDCDFYLWSENQEKIFEEKADLLNSLTVRFNAAGQELKLKGYYSVNDRKWCVVLPALYNGAELIIEAVTCEGGYEKFYRRNAEETIIFTWKDILYPIDFLCADNVDTVYVSLEKQKTLADIHKDKLEEVPGVLTVMDTEGAVGHEVIKGFYGHGNDSWAVEKKSYNLKFDVPVNLLGLGENEDFSLLACYRDNSLMCYATTTELCKELGFQYSPDFRFVNLYVAGEYAGVYFLAEKVELDQNRIDIDSVYTNAKAVNHEYMEGFEMKEWKDPDSSAARYFYVGENEPEDLTGGYLLEADIVDFGPDESRFVSTRGIPLTMKRARYSSEAQVNYIADYWQEFEDALFAPDGKNSLGKHYTEYIDLESFAMQWLIYELVEEGSMSSSIYFYKESDSSGDGLLHACFPWDMEHSYVMSDKVGDIWNLTEKSGTLYGYWAAFCNHKDFQQELYRVWNEKFVPAIDTMISEEAVITVSGMKNLRWYEEQLGEIHHLENSRWRKMTPLDRCRINREFLKMRKDVISTWLAE